MAHSNNASGLNQQIKEIERELGSQLRADENAARLLSIPGIGPVTASLRASEIWSVAQYAGGRTSLRRLDSFRGSTATVDEALCAESASQYDSRSARLAAEGIERGLALLPEPH